MKHILIIFVLSSCAVFAQEDFSSSEKNDSLEYNVFEETVPFWRMEKNWKLTPFDVFNFIPTLGVDLETKMTPNLSFQYGAAFIPSFLTVMSGPTEEQFNQMNGYRIRFESRWWGFKRPKIYVSSELAFRHLIIKDETAFGMEGDGNGNFAYFINQEMLYHRFSTHFNFKMGYQKVFSNSMVLDLFWGMSFRRNNVLTGSTPPEGGEAQIWWNPLEWRLENRHKFGYATPIVGFRIGWNVPAKVDPTSVID